VVCGVVIGQRLLFLLVYSAMLHGKLSNPSFSSNSSFERDHGLL
jgi:hypothetical protein